MNPQETRDLCFRCLCPQATCYCEKLRPFQTSGLVLVFLQHPRERKRTIGTARIAHLCIANSKLFMGIKFDQRPQVDALIEDRKNYCMVLYPGPQAINISADSPEAHDRLAPEGKKLVIFLIDGTWASAKRMIKWSPRLAGLPQVCFTPGRESEYGFRRQPHPHCLSTIEATHHLLEILEPSPHLEQLLELFRDMVKRQVKESAKHVVRSLKKEP
ncbi:tRNA-uridine aminocarboxypropyltransferase [Bdellovibrionota bacterium FG-2]